MYPVELAFENVGPYAGQHLLPLTDSVYAVLARHERNPERSNWLGKSTLLWLVPYALFGTHPNKTDNEWITRGTPFAWVGLKLDDGTVVERSKAIDKPTQLTVTLPGCRPLTQKAAQEAIEKHIGLGQDDFMATCFYEQKQLARMVSARSAERIEMVESWLARDLAPLQAMHGDAINDLAGVNKGLASKQSELTGIREDIATLATEYGAPDASGIPNALDAAKVVKQAGLGVARTALATAKAARLDAAQWQAKVEAAREFDDIAAEGATLRLALDGLPVPTPQDENAAKANLAAATANHATEAKRLADASAAKRGAFDGKCPVNGGACPSAKWVTSTGVAPDVLAGYQRTALAAKATLATATAEANRLQQVAVKRASLEGKLQALREQASALVDVANEVAECENPPDLAALDQGVRNGEAQVRAAEAELAKVAQDAEWYRVGNARLAKLQGECLAIGEQRALILEAVQLLGKTGAQQKLGEIALANVEDGANALLQAAGIALSVQVRWVTHLQGLAKHCDVCGAAYPGSDRVKACPQCGAKRGPNVAAKLVIDLSNRSGAAEDLAGIAVGLAASQWLRAKRVSGWSSVFIDEPFGALDAHHKRALSVHIATMLKRSFASAFVVAHDKAVLDALPSRVTIIGTDSGSKLSAE